MKLDGMNGIELGAAGRLIMAAASMCAAVVMHGQSVDKIGINWDKTLVVSKSTPTFQIVVNPPLRHGEPLSTASYQAVKNLGADYVRYQLWSAYPKLGVAELEPPTPQQTNWDFSLIDPMTKDFLDATAGHPTVVEFSTIPNWLFKTEKPSTYPADPNKAIFDYSQGTELRDPSGKELGDYFARFASWYVNGGFTDENNVRHESGYHYSLPYWEVLNEVEFEHKMNAEQYTERYDAIVSAVHKVSPSTKFVGLALALPGYQPGFFEYFLNPKNHKPGIPLDMISYHFYAMPDPKETIDDWQYTFFDQADGFLNTVRYVESIRKRLSPGTKTDTDELGSILPTDNTPADTVPPPPAYWNLGASLYAYLYIELSRQQIDIIGASQLVGYPTQYPSVSMMNWQDNKPNARYWVLKLIKDAFHPGDKLVETSLDGRDYVASQAFVTPSGRKLLLANMRNRAIDVTFPDAAKTTALTVDSQTGEGPARQVEVTGGVLHMEPFAVSVVSW